MTILELIRARCGVEGVDKKYAERIEKISGITEEKDGNIIAAVKNFKDNILPVIEEASGESEKAKQAAIEEYEKKHGLKAGKPIEEPAPNLNTTSKKDENMTDVEKLTKQIQDLTGVVTTMAEAQKKDTAFEVMKEKLKGKIDDEFIDKYAKRANLQAEDINKEVEAIVNEFNEDKQAFVNKAVASGNYQPISGGSVGDKSVDEWTKIMEGNQNASAGVVDLGLK